MAIRGSLKEASLPDVLQLLAMGKKSGCLSVTHRNNFGSIYFDKGRISYASIVNRRDRLGDILVKSRLITQAQLDEAIERSNAFDFGLHAAIFTRDLDRAHHAIRHLEVGGVIVNDSIILITSYREAREQGMASHAALELACSLRLRPVILTSLTTTLGLAPLMLESSPMGEMMVPLAVVICFGLMYGTTLILFVIPTILSVLEQFSPAQKKGVDYEVQFAQ